MPTSTRDVSLPHELFEFSKKIQPINSSCQKFVTVSSKKLVQPEANFCEAEPDKGVTFVSSSDCTAKFFKQSNFCQHRRTTHATHVKARTTQGIHAPDAGEAGTHRPPCLEHS